MLGWSKVVCACSGPARGELLRRHAAQALCTAGQHLLQEQDDLHVRLFSCCVTLLVDEDTDTRKMAAAFVRSLPWQHPRKFSVIHPNFALKMLYEYWSNHYCESRSFIHHLLETFKSESNICDIINIASCKEVDDLFEAQDINPYREATVMHNLSAVSLKKMLSQYLDQEVHDILMENYRYVVKQLASALDALLSTCQGELPLNVSCDGHVFRSLHGLYSNAGLLRCWLQTCNNERGDDYPQHVVEIDTLLKNHQKVPNLHPSLYQRITNTDG